MTADLERLTSALADRYQIERELDSGGMATDLAAESRGSAEVTEVTHTRHCWMPESPLAHGRFSDIGRAVALATSTR